MTIDAENQFNKIVDTAIEERVDFVLHSGDMFERVSMKNIDIQGALQALNRLSEANIPFLVIAGNHDRPFTKGVISPVAYVDFIKNCYSIPEYGSKKFQVNSQEVAVHGISYLKRDVEKEFKQISNHLVNASSANYQILMSHQIIGGAKLGLEWSSAQDIPIQQSLFPSNINFIAMGHIHRRQTLSHPENEALRIHYPGSPIVINFGERTDEKAISLVTITGQDSEIQNIRIPYRTFVERKLKVENPDSGTDIESEIRSIIERNVGVDKFLGIRLIGSLRLVHRRITMTSYYSKYTPEFAGFKIFNKDPRLTWLDHEGLKFAEGEKWLKKPLEELQSVLDDQSKMNAEKKAALYALGEEIVADVMEEE
jgi:DNA repair exonuclease SbcCD nuclease subunit